MTQVVINLYEAKRLASFGNGNEALGSSLSILAAERAKAVRSALAAARPVLPDDCSRQKKFLAARRIWNDSRPVIDTPAERYLASHGIERRSLPMTGLRYHPAVLHEPLRKHLPAMIAPVKNHDGEMVGIYRTYLAPDGSQPSDLAGGGERRMLGICFGAHVQMKPVDGFRLIMTESVEAAATIQQSCPHLPVWAAMSLGNMKSMLPGAVKELILCADAENRSPQLASKLIMDAVRAQMERGLTVLVAQPLQGYALKDIRLR